MKAGCYHIETYYNILWHCPDVANDPLFLPTSLSHGFPPTDLSEDFLDQSLCNFFYDITKYRYMKGGTNRKREFLPILR